MTDPNPNYTPGSWEHAAAQIIYAAELDMVSPKISGHYSNLFDSGMFIQIAACAWAELRRRNHPWTAADQIALMAGKQHDYGHGNIMKFGDMGVRVRLWDKIARYTNLNNRDSEARNETVIDTLIDMIGYVIIYQMLLNATFTQPLQEDM